MASMDSDISRHHISRQFSVEEEIESDQRDLCEKEKNVTEADILDHSEQLWSMMKDENFDRLLITHSGYLKLYQLSQPRLSEYDIILLDEAQDTNPVVSNIVFSQPCLKVLVGDPYQQIYTFRGAVDAMDSVEADGTYYLTESHRFGSCLGWISSKILSFFLDEDKKVVGLKDDSFREFPSKYTLLARANAGIFNEVPDTVQNAHLFRNNCPAGRSEATLLFS